MRNVNNLATTFAKIIKEDATATKDSTVYGTAVEFNGKMYVKLDGSERMTPIETTTSIKEGDRVTVLIKAHSATVTGNVTDPSTSKSDKKATDDKIKDLSAKVSEFGTIVAGKVSTEQLQAAEGRITDLESDNVNVKNELKAHSASITDLDVKKASIDDLKATNASIDNLKANMLTTDTLDAKYATIKNLEATDATIHNLSADYGDFKKATVDDLKARKAEIDDLSTKKLNATDAELKYANIDFSNIGVAAIEQFYATSGIIKDLVIGDQTVTGEIVGVTIKGDLIEGNTIVADKLVMKGDDGLFYKLNISAANGVDAEQTSYNSINGSIITAKSITATQISVKDLVAFDATIAGFHIKDTAIYSTGKESVTSTVRGIYLGKDGQLGFGDGNNYIKFYVDTDGKYKLGISAENLTFTTGQSVKDAIDEVDSKVDAIKSIDSTSIGYLVGDSGTTPPTGIWSAGVPVVPNGKYLWCQKITTYTDGSHDYEYSVSRTGDKGEQGIPGLQGIQGEKGDQGIQGPQGVQGEKGDQGIQGPQGVQGEKGDKGIQGPKGEKGATGETGPQGIQGVKGKDGVTYYTWVKYADSPTSGMSDNPSGKKYIGLAYNKISPNESTAYSDYSWSLIKGEKGDKGDKGSTGETGPQGPQGKQGIQGEKGDTGATGPQGKQGNTGETGPQGIQGPQGNTGPTGNGIKSISYCYARTTSQTAPSASSITATSMPALDAANKYLWQKETINFTSGQSQTSVVLLAVYGDKGDKGNPGPKGDTGPQGPQGIPGLQGIQGKKGDQGIQGAKGDTGATGPTGPQGEQGPQGIQGVKGTDGKNGTSSYFHIKYSNDGGKTFTANNGETVGIYIGTYVDNTEADSTSISKYTWQRLQGAQGPKGDQGIKGTDGTNGKTSYLHIKYSNDGGKTFTANNGENVGTYIGTCTDYNSGDPTTVSSYTWAKIKGEQGIQGNTGPQGPQGIPGLQGIQGEKGDQGIQGPQGEQGPQGIKGDTGPQGPQGVKGTDGKNGTSSYFHIAYANSADGKTSFSVSDPSNRAYIGTYVDNTPNDSTDHTKYTWQLVKGAQGPKGDQGIKGTDGTNGKTSYLHIAYANSADGKTGFDVSNSSGKLYIGQYTDFTQADSTNPASYSWTKIKGEQGPQGNTGATGPQGIQGNTGPTGPTGNGVKSTAVTYQASASATSAPTGTWSDSPVTTSASLPYMWTRTIITYTDNTTSTSYSVGCTPEGVSVGGRNYALKTSKEWSEYWTPSSGTNICRSICVVSIPNTFKSGAVFTTTIEVEWTNFSASGGTFSIWMQGSQDGGWNYSNPLTYNLLNINSTSGSKVFTVTNKWNGEATNYEIAFRCDYSSGSGKLRWRRLKVESGNKATDWSPAPEDQVSKGDVVNQVNSELKISGNSIALTTGHFTISAKNLTLDSVGNATFSGTVKAATIEGGTITGTTIEGGTIKGTTIEGGTINGVTIIGASGEFTKSFKVNVQTTNPNTKGIETHSFIVDDTCTCIKHDITNINGYKNGSSGSITLDRFGINITTVSSDNQHGTIEIVAGYSVNFILTGDASYNTGYEFSNGDVKIYSNALVSGNVKCNNIVTASKFISNSKDLPVKMYAGTKVCNSGDNACNFLSNSEINDYFGVMNASNGNTVVLVANGDANAAPAHFEGTSYVNGAWYAVYDRIVNGSIRINYLVVYFG